VPKARSLFIGLLAVFGGMVLVGVIVFVVWVGFFGRITADYILANAIRPSGREMPAIAGALPPPLVST